MAAFELKAKELFFFFFNEISQHIEYQALPVQR